MNIEFRKASRDALEMLVATRLEVLRAANQLDERADMSEVERASRAYYEVALRNDSHWGLLAFDGDTFVGAGGVSFYQVMPTYHNPTGRRAYIMNMYVRPEYRRRGIAMQILKQLVDEARRRGVPQITLEATDMGRPLYDKFGFVAMKCEMELP